MIRTARYKYITYHGDPVEQLFDMVDDPGETRNLAGQSEYASALEDHRRLLRQWEDRLEIAAVASPQSPKRGKKRAGS